MYAVNGSTVAGVDREVLAAVKRFPWLMLRLDLAPRHSLRWPTRRRFRITESSVSDIETVDEWNETSQKVHERRRRDYGAGLRGGVRMDSGARCPAKNINRNFT